MSPSDFDLELDELHKRSVGGLIGSETFDAVAFSQLYEYLCAKAEKKKASTWFQNKLFLQFFRRKDQLKMLCYTMHWPKNLFL